MTGFATGFAPFARMIADQIRYNKEQPERDAAAEERRQAAETRRLQNQSLQQDVADRKELRDAMATEAPTVGQQLAVAGGGNVFTSNQQFANQIADDEKFIADAQGKDPAATAQPTPAFAAGGKLFGDQASAQQAADSANVPAAQMSRAAAVLRKQGRFDEANKLGDTLQKWRNEGVDKAIDTILAGGNEQDAVAAYDGQGKDKFGAKDGIKIIRRYKVERPGYAPIDTAEVEITKDGRTQRVQDIAAVRYKLSENALEMAKTARDSQRQDENDNFNRGRVLSELDLKNRELKNKEAGTASEDAYRKGMIGIHQAQERRLSAATAAATAPQTGLTLDALGKADERFESLASSRYSTKGLEGDALASTSAQRNQFLVNSQLAFRTAHAAGVPVTPDEAALAAAALDSPKAGAIGKAKASDGAEYLTVKVNGRQIPIRKLDATDQPGPTVAKANAMGMQGVQPGSSPRPGAQLAAASAPTPAATASPIVGQELTQRLAANSAAIQALNQAESQMLRAIASGTSTMSQPQAAAQLAQIRQRKAELQAQDQGLRRYEPVQQ